MADNAELPVRPAEGEQAELSKNALKKAAKAEKAAAEKAEKKSGGIKNKDASQQGGSGKAAPSGSSSSKKKIEGAALIGIDVAKEDDFASWYQQVLLKGDMLDYYDVSGCFVLKVTKENQIHRIWDCN